MCFDNGVIFFLLCRQGKYPVHGKAGSGRAPELQPFNEFGQAGAVPRRGESLITARLAGERLFKAPVLVRFTGSEADSLAEYGDEDFPEDDPAKFTEDGSFIGQYGVTTPADPKRASGVLMAGGGGDQGSDIGTPTGVNQHSSSTFV